MNTTRTRLPVGFAAETRFELPANPPAPFRAVLQNEFEQLKARLLAEQLARATPGLSAPLRRAANEAAAVAWATVIPLLAFPALFEEKAALAECQARRQARIFNNSRDLVAA
ncbi:MAG TPA: hypothetical protein VGI03_06160 [Verrucomicrobiae bacterium]|jgi:hypothetical protein